MNWTVKVDKSFTDDEVEDLIITALEGGSNYWYDIIEVLPSPNIIGDVDMYPKIMYSDGVIIGTKDDDTINGSKRWTLNRHTITRGLQAWADNMPKSFAKFMAGDYDADDADVFLQYALFGEVVFG